MPGSRDPTSSGTNTPVETILIVEDDTVVAAFLTAAIEQETPYQALLATSSSQAFEVVNECKPSLFLLDYRLPGMSGLELYDQLHATKELEDVPALIISASCPWQEVEKRKILCMRKPIELDQKRSMNEKILDLAGRR